MCLSSVLLLTYIPSPSPVCPGLKIQLTLFRVPRQLRDPSLFLLSWSSLSTSLHVLKKRYLFVAFAE